MSVRDVTQEAEQFLKNEGGGPDSADESEASQTPGGSGRPRFVQRKNAPPVRQSDMLPVNPEDVDLSSEGPSIDPLEELLQLDTDELVQRRTTVDMTPEFSGDWTVQAMSNEKNEELVEQATYWQENPRTHEQIRQMNGVEYQRLVVAHQTKVPNLMDPRLFQKHRINPARPDLLVAKILLPGQIDRLAGAIMRISGFRDDLVKIAKNSSRRED